MPCEVLPYVLRAAIAKSPGSTAPGRTTTTLSPTEKFRAPQTISCGSPVPLAVPTSTVQKRMGFLKPSSSSMVRTLPTTRGPLRPTSPSCSTASTSRPADTSRACTSRPVSVAGEVDVLPQPGKRDAHQISIPNGRVNRTSDSTMSRMSSTWWRNISIRSMPNPKANPLYFSGSTPQATSTFGLTMPQPPSLDPALAAAGAAGPVGVADGRAAADVAEHVHLGGRLGEGEVVRPQPGLHVRAEERLDHVVEGALEVGHGEALVHGEQLDLVEDRGVRGVQLVRAVDPPRADHVHGRLAVEQGAGLDG